MCRSTFISCDFFSSFFSANELYEAAMNILNQTKQDEKQAYTLLVAAAELGHTKAMQKVAWARLLGHHLKPNVTEATEIFEGLSTKGNADAQMVNLWKKSSHKNEP